MSKNEKDKKNIDISQLRLAILDHPKKLLAKPETKDFLADIVSAREIAYQRASEFYVATDKLDLIGTHVLIYDCENLHEPNLISGLRLSYSDRCTDYNLKIPMDENIHYSDLKSQKLYEEYKKNKPFVVESNSWFVSPELSCSTSKVDFSQLICAGVAFFLLRQGASCWMTATNERFKASRRVQFGPYEDGHFFTHPSMPDPHKIILIDYFHQDWLVNSLNEFGVLLENQYELVPDSSNLKPFQSLKEEILEKAKGPKLKVA